MSKVNYYLKNIPSEQKLEQLKKANRKSYNEELNAKRPIIMSVAFHGKREIFTTGKFAQLRFWDKGSKRIKTLLDTPNSLIETGVWLDSKRIEIENFIQLAKSEYHSVSKDELHELINNQVKFNKSSDTLEDVLKLFFAEHKTMKGVSLKNNTLKIYSALIVHIISFQKNNIMFTPQQYSTTWVKQFKEYLMDTVLANDNTVCKYIKALKTFFNHFKSKGVKIAAVMNEIKVGETEQIVNIIEQKELELLEQKEFDNPSFNQIRDIFIFHCYTGVRYSDLEQIKHEDIKQMGDMLIWEFISEKTGQFITVPLFEAAKKILEKYKDLLTPLPRYTNQAINRELKKIAKIVELNRPVKKIAYYDNKITETASCLHEIISTHMARKTFISISLQMRLPERMVREITGHKDERSFRRYVNYNKTHLKVIAEAWDSIKLNP